MKAKEKAKELVGKYSNPFDRNGCIPPSEALFNATVKQCALIAVDEIIENNSILLSSQEYYRELNYWEEVKQEIEKL